MTAIRSLGHRGGKGAEGPPLALHGEVPRGFRLRAGEHSNMADGAGDCGTCPAKHRSMGDA